MEVVVPAMIILAGLGAAFGVGLAFASKVFAVETDPRVDSIAEMLPGANCGACGFAGCTAYAEGVVTSGASPSECIPGGPDTAHGIAGIMGVEAEVKEKSVAVTHCGGREAVSRFQYHGLSDCLAAGLLQGGSKACAYGCLGLGSCVAACPFGGIRMENGLPVIDTDLCVACGQCAEACPRNLIEMHPATAAVQVLCRSHDKGGAVRKACQTGCIGCKKCEKACEADAIVVEDFLATIDDAKCTQCGKCIEACPTKAIAQSL